MSDNPCLASIHGIPEQPTIVEVNVRSGPGTNHPILFKAPVGMSGLQILEIVPDAQGQNLKGKVYQWFKLVFHGGAVGWVRDDLLTIAGDCAGYGYGIVPVSTVAFNVVRANQAPASAAAADMTSAPPPAAKPLTPQDEIERIKKAAFAVTAAFEGTGYAAYNDYDAGIISYGLIQFTLAAGSLFTVVDKYLSGSKSSTAQQLNAYAERIRGRDQALRKDPTLKALLLKAAEEPEMRRAQDEVATINYWEKVVSGYITPRGLKLPFSYALLFDMGVNFGTGHGFVRLAEEQLGVAPRSVIGQNGITEEQLITKVAELRKASHDRQADRDKLPGLRIRGDFWVERIKREDWQFMGDAEGVVIVNGRKIQVRNP